MRVGATWRSPALAGSRLENSAVAHELPRRVCNLERAHIRASGTADLGAREGNEAETGAEMKIVDPRTSDCSPVGRNPVRG